MPEGSLRLFGRIDRFTCECPRCGEILRAHFSGKPVSHVRRAEAKKDRPTPAKGEGAKPADVTVYNPLTQRLQCTRCRRVFAVGLLLYPVGSHAAAQQPYDTKPTWQQLLAIRQLSNAAYFVDKPIRGRDSVNLAVDGVCICKDGRIDRVCAVHGWDEQLGPKTPAALQELARQAEHPTLGPPREERPAEPAIDLEDELEEEQDGQD